MASALKRLHSNSPASIEQATYMELSIELIESQRRCPVWNPRRPVPEGHQPGSLRASGTVQVHQTANGVSGIISYGDELVDYALYVHEDLEAFHAIGEAKFLESVLNESRETLKKRVAARALAMMED